MSTIPPVPSDLVDQVTAAFARGGVHIDADALDVHLAEIADKASCTLLRDQWKNHFPAAAFGELLSSLAALRDVLGYSPTPTAVEVFDWVREQRKASADAMAGPRVPYPVAFLDGPYNGVEMALDGPASGPLAMPPSSVPLAIVWGDTERPGHGAVRYKRADSPTDEGVWEYRLRTDDVAPPEGARPRITAPADGGGA